MQDLTKAPCYKDGHDCEKRCVGCRETCDDWQKWLVIHAHETDERRQKILADRDVNGFAMGQSKRIRQSEQERSAERRKGGIR